MKKFSLIFVLAFILFSASVNAEPIKSVDADIKNGEISISGEVEDGVLAVQILIYDETGKNEILMDSTDVNSDNKFSTKINVTDGKYIVRVADYEGGNIKEVAVPRVEENDEKTPETSDNVVKYIILLIVSLSGVILTLIFFKKKESN